MDVRRSTISRTGDVSKPSIIEPAQKLYRRKWIVELVLDTPDLLNSIGPDQFQATAVRPMQSICTKLNPTSGPHNDCDSSKIRTKTDFTLTAVLLTALICFRLSEPARTITIEFSNRRSPSIASFMHEPLRYSSHDTIRENPRSILKNN